MIPSQKSYQYKCDVFSSPWSFNWSVWEFRFMSNPLHDIKKGRYCIYCPLMFWSLSFVNFRHHNWLYQTQQSLGTLYSLYNIKKRACTCPLVPLHAHACCLSLCLAFVSCDRQTEKIFLLKWSWEFPSDQNYRVKITPANSQTHNLDIGYLLDMQWMVEKLIWQSSQLHSIRFNFVSISMGIEMKTTRQNSYSVRLISRAWKTDFGRQIFLWHFLPK